MIDKEKLQKSVDFFQHEVNTGLLEWNDNIQVLLSLASLVLDGKLVEPLTKDEVEKIVYSKTGNVYTSPREKIEGIIEALSGKVPCKAPEPMSVDDVFNEMTKVAHHINKDRINKRIYCLDGDGMIKVAKALSGKVAKPKDEATDCLQEKKDPNQDKMYAKYYFDIRAKFFDRFNVRHDCDYSLVDLIFKKFEELIPKPTKKKPMIKELEDILDGKSGASKIVINPDGSLGTVRDEKIAKPLSREELIRILRRFRLCRFDYMKDIKAIKPHNLTNEELIEIADALQGKV